MTTNEPHMWLWRIQGFTPWPEERDATEQEAVRRYGEPGKVPADPR